MKTITIDCASAENSRALHRLFADALNAPDWYGHNLDALHDLLTGICEETNLTLLNLGDFAKGFRRVLQDSQEENPRLTILIL